MDPKKSKQPQLGMQHELGGTAGRTHRQVLEGTLGRERATDDLVKGGPPTPEPDPSKK